MRVAAAARVASGQPEAAAGWLRQWSQAPETSADALQPLWRCNARWAERFSGLLREAGGDA